jgi:hypothetical protein
MAWLNRFASTFNLSVTAALNKLRTCFQLSPSLCSLISVVLSCWGDSVLNRCSTTDASRGSTPVASNAFRMFLEVKEVIYEAQKSSKKLIF